MLINSCFSLVNQFPVMRVGGGGPHLELRKAGEIFFLLYNVRSPNKTLGHQFGWVRVLLKIKCK